MTLLALMTLMALETLMLSNSLLIQLIATRSIQPMKISKQETNKNLYKDQTRLYANWEVDKTKKLFLDVLGPIGSGFRSVGSRIQNEEFPVLGLYIAKASCG